MDLILERLKEIKNMSNLDDIASFLDINRSTLGSRVSRGSIPYENIIAKLDADELAYVFKGSKRDSNILQEPSAIYDDPQLIAFEERIEQIAHTIEHAPFSQGLKIRLTESLLRMVGEELDELRKPSDPIPEVDN